MNAVVLEEVTQKSNINRQTNSFTIHEFDNKEATIRPPAQMGVRMNSIRRNPRFDVRNKFYAEQDAGLQTRREQAE